MKSTLIAGLVLVLGTAAVHAGPTGSATTPTIAVESLPPICDCFDLGGSSIDLFGVYIEPDGKKLLDSAGGGGVGFTHYVNSYLGFSTGVYWWDGGSHTTTSVSGSAIFRYPVRSLCVAPYLIAGGTGHFDSLNQFSLHFGGGLELRVPSLKQWGFFADATYNWADDTENYGVFRLGTRYHF